MHQLVTSLKQRKGPWDELRQKHNGLVSKQAGMEWRSQHGTKVMKEESVIWMLWSSVCASDYLSLGLLLLSDTGRLLICLPFSELASLQWCPSNHVDQSSSPSSVRVYSFHFLGEGRTYALFLIICFSSVVHILIDLSSELFLKRYMAFLSNFSPYTDCQLFLLFVCVATAGNTDLGRYLERANESHVYEFLGFIIFKDLFWVWVFCLHDVCTMCVPGACTG